MTKKMSAKKLQNHKDNCVFYFMTRIKIENLNTKKDVAEEVIDYLILIYAILPSRTPSSELNESYKMNRLVLNSEQKFLKKDLTNYIWTFLQNKKNPIKKF